MPQPIMLSSNVYLTMTRRQLDYIGEGIRWIERSREPDANFQQCMREARSCAKLAALCGRLANGSAR
jgi:hypothetical protein